LLFICLVVKKRVEKEKKREENKVVENFLSGVGSLEEVVKLVDRWQHFVFLFFRVKFIFPGLLICFSIDF